MKKLLLLIAISLLVVGCRQENEAMKIATEYVNKSILPILPGYEVSTINAPKVRFVKRSDLEQLTVVNKLESLRLDKIERKRSDLKRGIVLIHEETFKEDIIISSIEVSNIAALNAADSESGYYDVSFTIESAAGILGVTIVVSKDLRVINKPVDMDRIDQFLKECE